jgi:hypothetical protein
VPKKRAIDSVNCPMVSGSSRGEYLRDVRGV